MHPIIIIGTGLAGYQLARELRKLDNKTLLTLITADEGKFYSKPLLSTALTSGKTAETLATATATTMAEQLNACIITRTSVTAIDPTTQTIYTHDQKFSYSRLVLACGADVIKSEIIGNGAPDIFSINHLYHYAEFRTLIENKKHIAILGAGLIGCEFANDLSNAGYKVDVITLGKAPLDFLVPEKIGSILQTALERNGVQFHLSCRALRVDKKEKNYMITLSNSEELPTEFILSAIGLRPHTALAKTAGIAINRGILVNRYLETNIPHIYALGDCAEVEGHVLPYITPLLNGSRALARTLSGNRTSVDYPAMPVTVKTPAHPIVVSPPPKDLMGEWQIEVKDNNVRALFYDTQQKLRGFVLTNEAVKERGTLIKELPGLF